MDTKFMTHVGIEVTIIVAVAFFLNRKIDAHNKNLETLEEKMKVLEKIIENQQQALMMHEAVLKQFLPKSVNRVPKHVNDSEPAPKPSSEQRPKQKKVSIKDNIDTVLQNEFFELGLTDSEEPETPLNVRNSKKNDDGQ